MRFFVIFFCFFQLFFSDKMFAQDLQSTIFGKIVDENKQPIEQVIITFSGKNNGKNKVFSDNLGNFKTKIPSNQNVLITFSLVGMKMQKITLNLAPNAEKELFITLITDEIETAEISGKDTLSREQVSTTRLSATKIALMPSAFGDFNKILGTLAGVVSNNELSSTYSVRGGNFDENLVYVNDIQVYRPFLVRAGQQEGLSFINPNLVGDISFSSGGWQSKYGDKLSSVLDIQYKKPQKQLSRNISGSLTLGILNQQAHLEGISKNSKFTYLVGARRKSSRYLLNTLPVSGQYLPQFFDLQGYFSYKFSPKTSLSLLISYARNRYLVRPEAQETSFGTVSRVLRLLVEFDGQEQLNYDIAQNALKLTHQFNEKLTTNWILSVMNTSEREYSDVEASYRLCEVNTAFGTQGFNECVKTVGSGKNYQYLRNKLTASVLALENRSVWNVSNKHKVEFGLRYTYENIQDLLNEYRFVDSAGYVSGVERSKGDYNIGSSRLAVYAQDRIYLSEKQTLTIGIRGGFWSLNKEFLISPSAQYSLQVNQNLILKAAAGVYQQPPFYREMRDFKGNLNLNLRSQRSTQYIVGLDYLFKQWGRNFRVVSEAYYKDMTNIVPYDVDNVRLRYYAKNNAVAYATGVDARVSGEFIKGAESWFSVSYLRTFEDVQDDNKGYLRRPTDQRMTFGVFFEDHIPNNPTLRMNLNLVWGTGLPFGVPNQPKFRSAFSGPAYRRVDIGFSKSISELKMFGQIAFKSIWIGLDVLNLLGIENIISYTWVQDVSGQTYAVPNSLSARFVNLRLIGKF